jgi:hypothetical protein
MAERRPSARELLEQGSGYLTRSHLRELGLPRAAIDALLKKLDNYFIEGYTRPMVKVEDFIVLMAASAYGRDRVRPTVTSSHRQTMGRPPR